MEPQVERGHRKQATKITNGKTQSDCAWKNHRLATEDSRYALCLIYEVVRQTYYGDLPDLAHFRPREIQWTKVVQPMLERLLPVIFKLDGVERRDGSGPRIPTSVMVSGRWGNFFHIAKENGVNMWSLKDTENPMRHKELLPLMARAYVAVREMRNGT